MSNCYCCKSIRSRSTQRVTLFLTTVWVVGLDNVVEEPLPHLFTWALWSAPPLSPRLLSTSQYRPAWVSMRAWLHPAHLSVSKAIIIPPGKVVNPADRCRAILRLFIMTAPPPNPLSLAAVLRNILRQHTGQIPLMVECLKRQGKRREEGKSIIYWVIDLGVSCFF